ncbi:alpha/beta fold hydrolase [Nocardia rhamnosiphila]|uniref:alpha/beta fold hydrolase n=1 Tax=Nocardia rhamnosiphila TaxID=426716 RepID=UPI0033D3434D
MRVQQSVTVGGIQLSYKDFGGSAPPALALHGSFGRGEIFSAIAHELRGTVRLIAPDQRGHGHSDRADTYTCADFVADAARLLERLDLGPAVVLGHSRGGITAYQLAARYPDLVSALIIEDIGPVVREPEVAHPVLPVRGWPTTARTDADLADALRARGVPDPSYFLQSVVDAPDGGRRFLFDWEDMMAVQTSGVGDWWSDWLGSTCPALVLRGANSPMLPAPLATAMATRRPGTSLVEIAGAGHWIHDDAPRAMAAAVTEFLGFLPRTRTVPHGARHG